MSVHATSTSSRGLDASSSQPPSKLSSPPPPTSPHPATTVTATTVTATTNATTTATLTSTANARALSNLLDQPTSLPQLVRLARLPDPSQLPPWEPVCPSLILEACTKARRTQKTVDKSQSESTRKEVDEREMEKDQKGEGGVQCTFEEDMCPYPHFEPIMRPWTDPTLGQCSYLNMCYGDVSDPSLPSSRVNDLCMKTSSRPHAALLLITIALTDAHLYSFSPLPWIIKFLVRSLLLTKLVLETLQPAFANNPSLAGGKPGSKQCRYQHYRLIPPPLSAPPIPNPMPSLSPEMKQAILESVGETTSRRSGNLIDEPQWLNMDARRMSPDLLGSFDLILADPPWDIHMSLPYGTLSDAECGALPIPALQPTWGLLALWVTGRAMDLGRELFKEWGYRRIDEVVWVKVNQLGGLIRTGRTGHWLK